MATGGADSLGPYDCLLDTAANCSVVRNKTLLDNLHRCSLIRIRLYTVRFPYVHMRIRIRLLDPRPF